MATKFNPFVQALYFLSVTIISMFVNNPFVGILSFLGAAAMRGFYSAEGDKKNDLKIFLPLFVLITVFNPVFSHNGATPLFYLNGNAVTAEAFFYGASNGIIIVSVMIWCTVFGKIFKSDSYVYLFGKISPKLAVVFSVALRYIPLMRRQLKVIYKAQKTSGLYTSDSISDKIKGGMRVFSALIGWSLENAAETAKAMKAKGYGVRKRTFYSDYRFLKRDYAAVLTVFCLTGAVLFAIAKGYMDFSFYPNISFAKLTQNSVMFYCLFAVLSFLPALAELTESVKWNIYKSKI